MLSFNVLPLFWTLGHVSWFRNHYMRVARVCACAIRNVYRSRTRIHLLSSVLSVHVSEMSCLSASAGWTRFGHMDTSAFLGGNRHV